MMTTDKAQELFSAYFDGSLEPSLKRTLEVKFKAEPSLHDEYLAFESLAATQETLATHGYSADVRKGGLICILDR